MSEVIVYPDQIDTNIYKRMVINYLTKITRGCITFKDSSNAYHFGSLQDKLHATLIIKQPEFYRQIFWNGGIGLAEGYILGTWDTDNLTKLLQILTLNISIVDKVDQSFRGIFLRSLARVTHYFKRNNLSGSKKNIAKHYDLGNSFFQLFLDPLMMYSAAKFDAANITLEQASQNKLQAICRKLELNSNDHLLEIGTGWGGFAIYAAQHYGCHVTTTTISQEQYNYTRQAVLKLGLQHKITVLMQDYRELSGTYDKLVSIEMIEAVGHDYLGTYIQTCSKLLKPNGIFVLQSITISEQRYIEARDSVDFIKKYIFPGGFLPSIGEIMRYVRTHSDFNLYSLEDLTFDYATTLKIWRENFVARSKEILEQGFDMLFIRKWLYYFSYCEAGFRERHIGTSQLVLVKSAYRGAEYFVG